MDCVGWCVIPRAGALRLSVEGSVAIALRTLLVLAARSPDLPHRPHGGRRQWSASFLEVVDHFLDPINYLGDGSPLDTDDGVSKFQIGRRAVGAVDFRARNYEAINDLKRTSIDYYARVRTIYKQRRDGEISNGTPTAGTGSSGSTGEFEEYVPGGQPAERAGSKTPSS